MSDEAHLVFTRQNGEKIKFFLHESLADVDRAKIIKLVQKNGGRAVATDDGVDTVIVDNHYPVDSLQGAYFSHPNKNYRRVRVENIAFVHKCIRLGVFQHSSIMRYPMRGNGPGRMNYTKADEENLCRYLAMRIPDARSGGRLGHKIYADMVKLAHVMPCEYAWVTRHPSESWREHYRSKKNRERLDTMIEQFRREERPRLEQLYRYDRTLKGPMAIIRPPLNREQEEEESGSDEEMENEEMESEESDDHARPSSLFSVESYEDERVGKQTEFDPATAINEPNTSQATLIGPGNGSSAALRPSERMERPPDVTPVPSTPEPRRPTRPKRKHAQVQDGPFMRTRARSAGASDLAASQLQEPAINEPISVPETVTEEENVKRLLTAETNGDDTGRQPYLVDNDEGSVRRQRMLETDDEQIERRLGDTSRRSSPDPVKMLEEFESPTLELGSAPQGGRSSGEEDPWRESSEESFPLHGTRASAVKKRVEEKRKMEEYVPPPNTRAARFARRY